jgi:hypothetical protein
LLLLFFLLRLHNIGALPVFYDEAAHIRWAKLVWVGQRWNVLSEGKLLQIWLLAAFWPFAGALWLSRTAMVLSNVTGLAVLMRVSKELGAAEGGWVALGLYSLTPFVFFYDRMAFTEPMQTAVLAAIMFTSIKTINSRGKKWPVLTGIFLFLLVMTKILNILWIGIPAFALVLKRRAWRERLMGGEGDGQFRRVGHIAVDPQGNVYVGDDLALRITKFDNNGQFLTKWEHLTCQYSFEIRGLNGMWFDSQGRLYLGVFPPSICVLDQDGVFLGGWGANGAQAGQLDWPVDVVGNSAGNLYVVEYANSRIQKFRIK